MSAHHIAINMLFRPRRPSAAERAADPVWSSNWSRLIGRYCLYPDCEWSMTSRWLHVGPLGRREVAVAPEIVEQVCVKHYLEAHIDPIALDWLTDLDNPKRWHG